VSSSTAC